jgi:hypothetical protein
MSFIAPIATAVAPAVPYISAVTQVAAARRAKTLGQFNEAVQNRNAQVAEQEGLLIAQQNEFDLAQFDKKFARLQGETKTQILNSGVELSGSGLRILRANAEQAEVEKDIMDYNFKINQAKKFEEANFARIKGNVTRQNAKAAEVGYYSQAGTSLLKAFG